MSNRQPYIPKNFDFLVVRENISIYHSTFTILLFWSVQYSFMLSIFSKYSTLDISLPVS